MSVSPIPGVSSQAPTTESKSFTAEKTSEFILNLIDAASTGSISRLESLKRDRRFYQLSIENFGADLFCKAAWMGQTLFMQALMSDDRYFQVSQHYFDLAFINAANNGHTDVLRLLTSDKRFKDLDAQHIDEALWFAKRYAETFGEREAFRYLLGLFNKDPSNYIILK